MKRKLLTLILFLCASHPADAQITKLKYLIEYNDSTSLYDCKIVIVEGKTTTYPHRIQFNAQYSIVVPTGASFAIVEYFNPLESNQDYTGTIPCKWELSHSLISAPFEPIHDFHAITPNLGKTLAYNNLAEGDTIKLFSISVDVDPCDNSVGPVVEDDHNYDSPGDGGYDFSCGFTIGSINQIYEGNLYTPYGFIPSTEPYELCLGNTLSISTELEGIWASDNTQIATVDPSTGSITAISSGTANVSFLDDSTGCLSNLEVIVHEVPVINIVGDNVICQYQTTTVTGTSLLFSTAYPSIASVDNLGNVIGISPGTTTINLIDPQTGCSAEPIEITVLGGPLGQIIGSTDLCMGETGIIFTGGTLSGTWASNNPQIASVDLLSGLITAISKGKTTIKYTEENYECPSFISIEVFTIPTVDFIGSSEICIGELTNVSPNSGGIWNSEDPQIAVIDNSGNVSGIASGTTTFSFTSTNTGCTSQSLTITVLPESDPLCIVNTNEIEKLNIKVYPNPARDHINIESTSLIQSIAIYTLSYQLIKEDVSTSGKNSVQVSTNGLNPGLYLIAIVSGDNTYYKKITIE